MTANEIGGIDTCLLTPQMKRLTKIIGLSETLQLLKHYGGHRVRIPTTGRSEELEQHINPCSIEKLSLSEFAGLRMTMPKSDKFVQQLRNMDIVASRDQCTKRQLAKKYNLTSRWVQKILNSEKEDNPTLDLFD
jgi:hypothetical protein